MLDDAIAACDDDEVRGSLWFVVPPKRLDRIHRAAVAGITHTGRVGLARLKPTDCRQSPADAARGQRVIEVEVAMLAASRAI